MKLVAPEPEEEVFVFALPYGEGEEGEQFVLPLVSPEEAAAILNATEEDDSDYVVRHNAWNPR